MMVLRLNKLAESMVGLHTRLLRPGTNFLPFKQCTLHSSGVVDNARKDPFPVAPNCYAKKSPRHTAGDVNILNYTILYTFELHARRV